MLVISALLTKERVPPTVVRLGAATLEKKLAKKPMEPLTEANDGMLT